MDKQKRSTGLFPYKAEDLEPRNMPDEAASEDAFIERNRDALNLALKEGQDDIARGKIRTAAEVVSDLAKQRRARKRKT